MRIPFFILALISITCLGQQEYEAEEFVSNEDLGKELKQMQQTAFIGTQIACEAASEYLCDSADNAMFEGYKGKIKIPVNGFQTITHYQFDNEERSNGDLPKIDRLMIGCVKKTPIYSVASGEVTAIFDIPGNGVTVIVKHGSYRTVYSGIKKAKVELGDIINERTLLGINNRKGSNNAIFEIWKREGENQFTLRIADWVEL